jgi:hypothetical protein
VWETQCCAIAFAGLWIVLVIRPAAGRANGDALRAEYVALGTRAAIFSQNKQS